MNTNASAHRPANKTNVTAGVVKRLAEVAAVIVLYAVLLFASSGRLDWLMAWVYVGVYFAVVTLNSLILLPKNPELVAERAQPKENTKDWDKIISGLVGFASLGALVVAGLDVRFGWTAEVGPTIHLVATVFLVLGYALFSWAMLSNAFFSTTVRIQDDRGHAVASAGPYRYVRHPGYDGWIIMSFATPLMLGSWWALIPGTLSALLMVVRTALEDKTLLAELDGYMEYAVRVRYRLLPGVW